MIRSVAVCTYVRGLHEQLRYSQQVRSVFCDFFMWWSPMPYGSSRSHCCSRHAYCCCYRENILVTAACVVDSRHCVVRTQHLKIAQGPRMITSKYYFYYFGMRARCRSEKYAPPHRSTVISYCRCFAGESQVQYFPKQIRNTSSRSFDTYQHEQCCATRRGWKQDIMAKAAPSC